MASERAMGLTRREFLERSASIGLASAMTRLATRLTVRAETLSLENEAISATWTTTDGILRAREIGDLLSGAKLAVPE